MMAVRKVLIVGGGPAGLCAATVLGSSGIDVEIAEVRPDLKPQGVGLAVIGPSLRALAMVDSDLLGRCIEAGAAHRTMSFGSADGDAAHTATPQLAMGAGIAIEDAVVLGDVLGPDTGADGADGVGGALARFMGRRYERCRMVVQNSLQLSEWDKHPGDPRADPAGLSDASFAALAAPF